MTESTTNIQLRIQKRRTESLGGALREVALIIGGVIVILLFIAVCIGAVGGWPAVLLLLIAMIVAVTLRTLRRRQAFLTLQYIEQAVRQNLPLPQMLEAAAIGESGGLRRRLHSTAGLLRDGATISQAIDRTLPGLPSRTVRLIDAAENLGVLPDTLARLTQTTSPANPNEPMDVVFLHWYPLIVLPTIIAAWVIITQFVAPKFVQLIRDMHGTLPVISRLVWGDLAFKSAPLVIGAAILSLIGASIILSEIVRGTNRRFRLLAPITDRIVIFIPILRQAVQSRDLSEVCRTVSTALRVGQPVDSALMQAAEACGNRVMEARVLDWAANVSAGLPLADAATQSGLPAMLVGMLRTSEGTDQASDAMEFLGSYYSSRSSTALVLLRGAAVPAMTLAFASLAVLLALSVLMPMIELINVIPTQGRVR